MKSFRFSLLSCSLFFLLTVCAAAQENGAAKATEDTINLPGGTAIVARLVGKFDSAHFQKGDRVDARITHDIKDGHQVVLAKGSLVVGRVSHLLAPPTASGLYGVAINFDTVELKNGPVVSLHLEIQAIAPPPAQSVNAITDLPYNGGNHVRADEHGVEPLTAQSKGVIALPELILGIEASGKGRTPFIASRNQNIHLDKDSQIVFRIANP